METMTDTEVLARLIYRAYIQPDPRAPLEAESLLPFRAALDLYARTARKESLEIKIVGGGGTGGLSKHDPVRDVWDSFNNNVSESDTGTKQYADPTEAGIAALAERAIEILTEPSPAPARKKSETGMRGLNGGKATEEKREIYARLMAFCGSHGLGARRRIAEASGGKLSIADVQDMTDAKQKDIKLWRAAAAAMDRIEKEEDHATEEI